MLRHVRARRAKGLGLHGLILTFPYVVQDIAHRAAESMLYATGAHIAWSVQTISHVFKSAVEHQSVREAVIGDAMGCVTGSKTKTKPHPTPAEGVHNYSYYFAQLQSVRL